MLNFDQITSNIYVGSAPYTAEDVEQLKQVAVTSVISLQSDEDLTARKIDWSKLQIAYADAGISAQRFPINDFDENDLADKIVEPIRALDVLLKQGDQVYVHCNAGMCRAPSVVLGYLCHYQSLSIESGAMQIRNARRVANPFHSAVHIALQALAENN